MNSVQYLGIFALLLADALQMAFRTAVMSLTDGDLSDSEDHDAQNPEIPEPARSQIRQLRENPAHLTRAVWFWHIAAASFGTVMLQNCLHLHPFLLPLLW